LGSACGNAPADRPGRGFYGSVLPLALQEPDRPGERIEPLPVHLVPATTQHHQVGILGAAPAVALFSEVQAQLGQDHARERDSERGGRLRAFVT